jgi:hypothetical protein
MTAKLFRGVETFSKRGVYQPVSDAIPRSYGRGGVSACSGSKGLTLDLKVSTNCRLRFFELPDHR